MRETVSILGCGWLGLQLGKELISRNYAVKGSTTTPLRIFELSEAEIQPYFLKIEPNMNMVGSELFFQSDVLVISLPPGRDENAETTFPLQISGILKYLKYFEVRKVIFISSTSVYEATNREVREGDEGNPDKPSGKALLKAEKLLLDDNDFKTTVIRFGGLIGPGRYPAVFHKKIHKIPGNVPVNLIHSSDCINIICKIIQNKVWGEVFNACCPKHPTRREFYTMAAEISGLAVPHFTNEPEKYKIVNSDKLQKRLEYTFRFASPLDFLSELSIP